MTSFDSNTPTPSAVSDLVASTPTESNANLLRDPIANWIDSEVQAYAKLEGEDFYYYVCKLQVTLGRKVSIPDTVDVPLGSTKSVSRQHARLSYNFALQNFELTIFGKNGAFVNEQFIERGVTVSLEHKTKIQIGEMAFVFLLPPKAEQSNNNHVNTSNNQNSTSTRNIEELGYISTPHQLEKIVTTASCSESVRNDFNNKNHIEDEDMDFHNSRDIKPPYSYASLIAQAINSSRDKRMTLNGIYKHITTNYPYYQMTQNGWQNSIRHNLSLNKAFLKVARSNSEPGKGAFWMIDSNTELQLSKGLHKRQKRPSQQYDSQAIVDNVTKKLKAEENVLKIKLQLQDPDNKQVQEQNASQDIASGAVKEQEEQVAHQYQHHVNSNTTDLLSSKEIPSTTGLQKITEPLAMSNLTSVVKTPSISTNDDLVSDSISSTSANKKTSKKETKLYQQETDAQAQQLQEQLQNTIRRHLLDPVLYPLPPSIAQLLPQAVAQLPPELATLFSSSVQKSSESAVSSTETAESSMIRNEIMQKSLQTDKAIELTSTDSTVIDTLAVQKPAKTKTEEELSSE